MSKLLIFFPLFLYSYLNHFKNISLKKDEIYHIKIDSKYDLYFRWTLFINDTLIVLYNYDTFPYQVALIKNENIKIKLKDIPQNYPYLLIKFKEFKNNQAFFEIYQTANSNLK